MFIIFLLSLIGLSQGIRYCCSGVAPSVTQAICHPAVYTGSSKCFTETTIPTAAVYGCSGDNLPAPSTAKTCTTDYCNCPPEAHKTVTTMGWFFGDMRKIMYPVMGILFAVIWIALAFLGGGPVDAILMVVALIDAIFGIFLIFLPVTAYLGLFYVAIGAFTLAVSKHSLGGKAGMYFLIVMTIVIFLLTAGLTFIALSASAFASNYFDQIESYITSCEGDMNIINWELSYWNLDTRCENWALFTAFCVFFLFLVQPIALLELFFKKSGGGHDDGNHNTGQNAKSNPQ